MKTDKPVLSYFMAERVVRRTTNRSWLKDATQIGKDPVT